MDIRKSVSKTLLFLFLIFIGLNINNFTTINSNWPLIERINENNPKEVKACSNLLKRSIILFPK